MFLASGERLGAVDVLAEAWSGKPPADRCPRIARIDWDRSSGQEVEPPAPKPEGRRARRRRPRQRPADAVRWEVRSESMDRREGGDREAEPPPHPESFVEARGFDFSFKAPTLTQAPAGSFVFDSHDGKGNAATLASTVPAVKSR